MLQQNPFYLKRASFIQHIFCKTYGKLRLISFPLFGRSIDAHS